MQLLQDRRMLVLKVFSCCVAVTANSTAALWHGVDEAVLPSRLVYWASAVCGVAMCCVTVLAVQSTLVYGVCIWLPNVIKLATDPLYVIMLA